MYTITTSPGGRTDTADTIPHALAALVNQLTTGLPDGPVTWSITDPNGDEHRGREYLNGRLELLQEAIDQLADELYTETSPICRRGTTRHRPLEKKNPSRNYHRQPGQRTGPRNCRICSCQRQCESSGGVCGVVS